MTRSLQIRQERKTESMERNETNVSPACHLLQEETLEEIFPDS